MRGARRHGVRPRTLGRDTFDPDCLSLESPIKSLQNLRVCRSLLELSLHYFCDLLKSLSLNLKVIHNALKQAIELFGLSHRIFVEIHSLKLQ